MLQAIVSKIYGLLLVILAITPLAYAQVDIVCLEPYGRQDYHLCNNSTDLPAKVCGLDPSLGHITDLSFYCSEYVFGIWRDSCPKKNVAVANFCGTDNPVPCFLLPCTTNADCQVASQPQAPLPDPPKQCYDCCQICFEDAECDIRVNNSVYAPRGDKNCNSCLATCENGRLESAGFCNCNSGFTSNSSLPLRPCNVPPPSNCLPISEASPMENNVFPSIANLQAQRNTVSLRISSSFVSGRKTLIEFPNSECNLVNNPSYYNKTTSACSDVHFLEIPFADCGFAKTAENNYEIYRGVMHVKHIDEIHVDGEVVDRVLDTLFTIAIRLPKNLAVQTSVEIATPVATAVKAALIGQTVDATTQTGQLTFLTSAPDSLSIISGRVESAPSGVSATLRFIDQNCRENSTAGFCQQRLAIDLSIAECDISGVYVMQVQVACSHQQNCPIGFNGTVNVTLLASITAQSTCGEAFVDVGLSGSLQAFEDQSFIDQALSFNFGKRSYFLVNTFASRDVVIAGVTLDSVYYYGPNVPGNFLLTNGSASTLATLSNFAWGQHSNSQGWFAVDVTVSRPDSSENTLFKLNNDESGVYEFIASVSVDWIEDGASVKKRMVLEGKTFSQGSQFTAQVQISNTKEEEAVSTSSVVLVSSSSLLLSVLASLF